MAAADFDAVLAMLPGELAPKLAIAATAELRDARDDALRFYETVWRTEHSYYSAAFGLARQLARGGPCQRDRGAGPDRLLVGALHRGGATAIEILLDRQRPENLDEQTLLDAGERSAALRLESGAKRARIRLQCSGRRWAGCALETEHCDAPARCSIRRGRNPGRYGARVSRPRARDDGMWDRIAMVEKANAIGRGHGYDGSSRDHQQPTQLGPEAHTGWG